MGLRYVLYGYSIYRVTLTHTHTHTYYSQDFVELLQWLSDRVGVAYNPNLNPHLPTFRVAFFPLLCLLGEVYNGYMDVCTFL